MNIIECAELGKRYRCGWALRDCTLSFPAGHVVALVGPNGAGKTTLLNLAVGLATATTGAVTVLDGMPAGSPDALGPSARADPADRARHPAAEEGRPAVRRQEPSDGARCPGPNWPGSPGASTGPR